MNIENILNRQNKLLLDNLRMDFQIEFEPREIEFCSVLSKGRHSIIYFNPKLVDNESIAHELLHIQLDLYNYVIGNYIYTTCQTHKKLEKIFSKFLCDYIQNCFDHHKMYPKYIEMGYSPEKFVKNGLEEKCSLRDIKLLNLSFLGTFNGRAVNKYIGYLISIFADHVDNDYKEHIRLLRKKEINLFDIVSKFWQKWRAFDIEKIDSVYNSDSELVKSFISDMEKWVANKRIK